jgi:hypothetical protein
MMNATANYDLFSSALDHLLGVDKIDCDFSGDPGPVSAVDSTTDFL